MILPDICSIIIGNKLLHNLGGRRMSREHKRALRTMKDGNTIALDTMTGFELLDAAELCLHNGQGDNRYKEKAKNIVRDAKVNRNLYVTLTMRRVLMGYIRPVFEAEWRRRQASTIDAPTLSLGNKRQERRVIGYGNQ